MKPFKTHVHSLIVLPEGEPIFSEMATVVSLDDEAAGLFITITQYPRGNENKVSITSNEWPAIKTAIEQMLDVCKEIEVADNGVH